VFAHQGDDRCPGVGADIGFFQALSYQGAVLRDAVPGNIDAAYGGDQLIEHRVGLIPGQTGLVGILPHRVDVGLNLTHRVAQGEQGMAHEFQSAFEFRVDDVARPMRRAAFHARFGARPRDDGQGGREVVGRRHHEFGGDLVGHGHDQRAGMVEAGMAENLGIGRVPE